MSEQQTPYEKVDKFDRIRGKFHDLDVALFTKESTITTVTNITGKAETFIVQTCRVDELGDYIYVQCIDEHGTVRLALPPKVANVIASQRDSLTTQRRRKAAQHRAAQLTEADKDVLRKRLAKARKQRKQVKG